MKNVPDRILKASAPQDWTWHQQISLQHPTGYANVLFTSAERQENEHATEDYVRALRDSDELPGYDEQFCEFSPTLGLDEGVRRRYTWTSEMGVVIQWQFTAFAEVRVYNATATILAGASELEPDVLAVLESLKASDTDSGP